MKRSVLSAAFLLSQLVWIIGAHLGDSRYFCWAPNDYMVSYRFQVRIGDRLLTDKEIQERYRVCCRVYQNIATHLIDTVRQYETTYGRNDGAKVTLFYSTNGGPERTWVWPPRQQARLS